MTRHAPGTDSAPEGTRAALIDAGLHLFAHNGFDASSTRQIAARAGANIASIAYHFGGKEGLRRACGAEVARRIGSVLAVPDLPPGDVTPATAVALMEAAMRRIAAFMTTGGAATDVVGFMLREVEADGPVLDDVYATLIEPAHRRFCTLWSIATGAAPESEDTRLAVFTLFGQAIYFRVGAPVVRRRMGWPAIGAAEGADIAARLVRNLHALLADARRS